MAAVQGGSREVARLPDVRQGADIRPGVRPVLLLRGEEVRTERPHETPPVTGGGRSGGGAESRSQSLIRVPRMPTALRGAAKLAACPTCGKDLTWIPQYDRFYCYAEKKYAPKGYAAAPTAGPAIQLGGAGTESHVGHYHCPSCGRELTFIAEDDRPYCYAG